MDIQTYIFIFLFSPDCWHIYFGVLHFAFLLTHTGCRINIFPQSYEKISQWFINFNTGSGFVCHTELHANGNVWHVFFAFFDTKTPTHQFCKTLATLTLTFNLSYCGNLNLNLTNVILTPHFNTPFFGC